jgi:5-methylcytosine-specific restriction endonuclease McrBC GTP-binding regulatory subunit McrB
MGQNLRFVGTVNVDETTHFFSPKVIDRAPIATFERPNLRLGLEGNQASRPPGRVDPVHLEDFLSWIRPPDQRGEAVDLVLSLDEILRRFRLGLGFRVRDRILRYVSSARQLLGEDRALDLALLQNAVPALRSTAPRYQDLLRELQQLLVPGRFRRTSQALQTLAEDPESDYFQLL